MKKISLLSLAIFVMVLMVPAFASAADDFEVTEISEKSPITMTFPSDIVVSTVTTSTVQVNDQNDKPLNVIRKVAGKTLTITPATKWPFNQKIVVYAGSVKTKYGYPKAASFVYFVSGKDMSVTDYQTILASVVKGTVKASVGYDKVDSTTFVDRYSADVQAKLSSIPHPGKTTASSSIEFKKVVASLNLVSKLKKYVGTQSLSRTLRGTVMGAYKDPLTKGVAETVATEYFKTVVFGKSPGNTTPIENEISSCLGNMVVSRANLLSSGASFADATNTCFTKIFSYMDQSIYGNAVSPLASLDASKVSTSPSMSGLNEKINSSAAQAYQRADWSGNLTITDGRSYIYLTGLTKKSAGVWEGQGKEDRTIGEKQWHTENKAAKFRLTVSGTSLNIERLEFTIDFWKWFFNPWGENIVKTSASQANSKWDKAQDREIIGVDLSNRSYDGSFKGYWSAVGASFIPDSGKVLDVASFPMSDNTYITFRKG